MTRYNVQQLPILEVYGKLRNIGVAAHSIAWLWPRHATTHGYMIIHTVCATPKPAYLDARIGVPCISFIHT